MKRIEIDDQNTADLVELVKRLNANAGTDPFNSHGPLTVKKLAATLLEDAGMVISRPGSWEGANMADVLRGHGYKA
ncbi:hypothetical protein [Acidithiobacillus sp.]